MYKLYQEEFLIKDLVDQYNFFLCNLLPNNINIFPLIEINDEIIQYIKENYYSFRYLIFPVYKHLWRQKKIYIVKNKLICNIDNNNHEFYNYNDDILKEILINNDIELHKNDLYIKKLNLYCTFEAYSYLYLNIIHIINSKNLNYIFILGVLEASIELGICSIPFKQIGISQSLFNFSKISLKSLYVTNQIQIFKAWLLKSDVLLTGGTGIGKTSQIPKLFWWINFLYDGFENMLDFYNFNFNLLLMPNIKIKATIISLPRKILITENSINVAKSLGFEGIKNSPINCLFKDVRNTIFYNNKANKFINPFTFSINRLTPITNVNTLIFDEIHEHDTYADIGITKAKYYKKKNNITNIVLISATVSDDLDDIYKFLPNIQRIHIKGETLYKIISLDYSEHYKNIIDLAKIINKYSIDVGKSTLVFLPSVSMIIKTQNELEKLLNLNYYVIIELHRQILASRDILSEIVSYPRKHVIILSTPVAESSLTITNVNVVIDYGMFYCKQFFSGSTIYITDSMMKQRKGRIGRVGTGIYINLFPLDKINKHYKKIDYEFLLPYIINCYYYNIKLENMFILPTDITRFNKTLDYFKTKNLNINKNINRIYEIYNMFFVSIPEYLIVYLYGNRDMVKVLEIFENSHNKIKILNQNRIIMEMIAKYMNIQFTILRKNENNYKIQLLNYYEQMPPIMAKIIKIKQDKKYLLEQNIGLIC